MSHRNRWYIHAYLEVITTETSGELLGTEGEWYIDCNGQRFPHKGHIKLSKHESFIPPDPKPTLYSTVLDFTHDTIKLHFKVKEEDTIKDDLMLDAVVPVHLEQKNDVTELVSKDGKVKMKIHIDVLNNNAW